MVNPGTNVPFVPWLIPVRMYHLHHGYSSYECITCTMVNPGTSVSLVLWLIMYKLTTYTMINHGTNVPLVSWLILVRAGRERLILQVGQNGRETQDNRLSTGGVTGKIT